MFERKPKILMFGDPASTASWYRGVGPFARLLKEGFIDLTTTTQLHWPLLLAHDILFLMSPLGAQTVEVATAAKSLGMAIWADWDDDFANTPKWHNEYRNVCSDGVKASLAQVAKLADAITVTTPALKAIFDNLSLKAKVDVVPNAIDDVLFPAPRAPAKTPPRYITWRGGKSHGEDLRLGAQTFVDLQNKNVRTIFMGGYPESIAAQLVDGMYSFQPWTIPSFYAANLARFNAPFHFVPLVDHPFNYAKSNIAFLESTWIGGSLCVTTPMGDQSAWPGCMVVDADKVADFIFQGLQHNEGRVMAVHLAQTLVRERYLLSSVNKKRVEIIAGLLA